MTFPPPGPVSLSTRSRDKTSPPYAGHCSGGGPFISEDGTTSDYTDDPWPPRLDGLVAALLWLTVIGVVVGVSCFTLWAIEALT